MPLLLRFEVIGFALILILITFYFTAKNRISVKIFLVWFVAEVIILIPVVIPYAMETITKLLGFEMFSNLIFSILIGVLMLICLALTIIVSGQREKIILLIQEVSIIKKEIKK